MTTDLVLQTDREDLSARFSLSAFVTDWEVARKAFIACIADTFREPLNPQPEDFSTAFPTELGEAWCKYRIFGGSSTIVLRADSLALNFANIVRADYAIVGEVLRRSADVLLPALGSYVEHSYHISTNQHAMVINGNSQQYLAQHAGANIEIPAPHFAMEFPTMRRVQPEDRRRAQGASAHHRAVGGLGKRALHRRLRLCEEPRADRVRGGAALDGSYQPTGPPRSWNQVPRGLG